MAEFHRSYSFYIALLFLLVLFEVCKSEQSVYNQRLITPNEDIIIQKKRPFCNTFTGCGRKRSNLPSNADYLKRRNELARQNNDEESVMDIPPDNTVEELARQLINDARRLEAIEEARNEMYHRVPVNLYPGLFGPNNF